MRPRKILIVAAALVMLATAAYLIIQRMMAPDPHAVRQVYYINDATLEPCLGPGSQFPPLARPEGELVWGFYYSCDGCKTRKLGYLQKYSLEAKQRLDESAAQNGGFPAMGDTIAAAAELSVRAPVKDAPWYNIRSPEGQEVTRAANCGPGNEKNFGPCIAEDDKR